MRVNESAAASTKVVGATAIISRALYRMLTSFDIIFKITKVATPYNRMPPYTFSGSRMIILLGL